MLCSKVCTVYHFLIATDCVYLPHKQHSSKAHFQSHDTYLEINVAPVFHFVWLMPNESTEISHSVCLSIFIMHKLSDIFTFNSQPHWKSLHTINLSDNFCHDEVKAICHCHVTTPDGNFFLPVGIYLEFYGMFPWVHSEFGYFTNVKTSSFVSIQVNDLPQVKWYILRI